MRGSGIHPPTAAFLPSPIHAKFSDPRKLRKALCERDFNSYTLKIHPHDLQMSHEFNDELCEAVAWRRFPCEEKSPRLNLRLRIVPQSIVEHHDPKCVQELALVFVDTFDLAIED
jgi:hypothetical protein